MCGFAPRSAVALAALALAISTPAGAQCRYQTLHHPDFKAEAHFGRAIATDGGTAAVSTQTQSGSDVTIFERDALGWRPVQVLPLISYSGYALALQGDTLLVGSIGPVSGHTVVQEYERQGGTWIWVRDLAPDPPAFDSGFGRAIAR